MAIITLEFPLAAPAVGVTLATLANATTGASLALPVTTAFTGPVTLGSMKQWTLTFDGTGASSVRWTGVVTNADGSTSPIGPGVVTGDVVVDIATGRFTDQTSLSFFLGATVLARLSNHKPETTTNNVSLALSVPATQQAINYGASRIIGRLSQARANGGPFFAEPFTVAGIMPRLATNSVAGPLLMLNNNRAAGWQLVEGMRTASLRGDAATIDGKIVSKAAEWLADCDADLSAIVAWANAAMDGGLYVDLDRSPGVTFPAAAGSIRSAPFVAMGQSNCGWQR